MTGSGGGGLPDGECVSDCVVAEDCAQPISAAHRAVCTNEGQCRVEAYPPRLFVLEPEDDTLFDEGTRSVRVSGEVESASSSVRISVSAANQSGCSAGLTHTTDAVNPKEGTLARIPFVIDGITVDPGQTNLTIVADVEGSRKVRTVAFDVACPGCAAITMTVPVTRQTILGLELPTLSGSISPAIPSAVWRVRSRTGDVFDGTLPLKNGRFLLERIPIFAGRNTVEVVASGVGDGLGENRCTQAISSAVARETGLRVVLTWDGSTSDLDLIIVGPGGRLWDEDSMLSPRSPSPRFEGRVEDDFDGLGPETAILESMADGVYGIAVEAVYDGQDPGSNALIRLLFDGRSITTGPVGPLHLSANRGELWIVGVVRVEGGVAVFTPIDSVLVGNMAPETSPDLWLDAPF
ncbi:MAG: hypothetical protein H6729_06120 [Deltaproteobacteria bacterium]|nr:hypothetical protein [Deltaproteobacteria bacterium]